MMFPFGWLVDADKNVFFEGAVDSAASMLVDYSNVARKVGSTQDYYAYYLADYVY